MKPYNALPEALEWHGDKIYLDLSYSAFYAALDALNDARLGEWVKLETALDILTVGEHPVEPELLTEILNLVKDDSPKTNEPKRMDIEQDWDYICAAFQQAYNIDLYTDKSIHILRFRALLKGLPKTTKLSEIVGIRAAKIPTPNKHNQEQIAELTRLKTYYALRGGEMSMQDGWARLFEMLSARAKKDA